MIIGNVKGTVNRVFYIEFGYKSNNIIQVHGFIYRINTGTCTKSNVRRVLNVGYYNKLTLKSNSIIKATVEDIMEKLDIAIKSNNITCH